MVIHVPQESVELMLRYEMAAAGLWKALVSSYMATGCCNSKDRCLSIEKLQSLGQKELLEIFEPTKRSFRYNMGHHTQKNLRFT
jgi:hypothetical protein